MRVWTVDWTRTEGWLNVNVRALSNGWSEVIPVEREWQEAAWPFLTQSAALRRVANELDAATHQGLREVMEREGVGI